MTQLPNVPAVSLNFPVVNCIAGWGDFSRETIEAEAGKLLMLDLDFGNVCSRNCPHCFRRSPRFNHNAPSLSTREVKDVIIQARELGLREVKILGAGEPFENKEFLPFLHFLHQQGITAAVFTKGHVFGDDTLAEKYNAEWGISTGEELAHAVNEANASVLVGFNSMIPKIQDEKVGVFGHTALRNRAIEILTNEGFNDSNPTRMGLGSSPTTTWNITEMFEIYVWARERNMHPVVCPTMVSGRCADEASWRSITPDAEDLIELYTKIYRWNIENSVQTSDQVQQENISAYAGTMPCNQIACGLYVTLDGIVLGCPGDDVTIHGDVRKQSLKEIWLNSPNRCLAGRFNCGCPAKCGRSIPNNLFSEVMKRLRL